MHRQRILERVGWQFWRCFASTFVRKRKEVIEDLINTLTEKGIEPIGKDSAPRSIHTEHRRVTALKDEFSPTEDIVEQPLLRMAVG